jgi:adenosylhomocysteinase
MILDDGGDATLLLHLGAKAEQRPRGARQAGQRGGRASCSPRIKSSSRRDPTWYSARLGHDQGRHRGDHHRRASPVPDAQATASSPSRRSTSTTRSPSPSSTTSTAAASRWSTASSAPPT